MVSRCSQLAQSRCLWHALVNRKGRVVAVRTLLQVVCFDVHKRTAGAARYNNEIIKDSTLRIVRSRYVLLYRNAPR